MRYDLVIVGHIVLDQVVSSGEVRGPMLGGPCTYAGLAARALGARVALVSKVGRDFGKKHLAWLRAKGIAVDWVRISISSTTRFKIEYQDSGRRMEVSSQCDAIAADDVSVIPSATAVHLGSVLSEIPSSLAIQIAKRNPVVSLDAQGYLRGILSTGEVREKEWRDDRLLREITVLKVSEQEAAVMTRADFTIRQLSKLGPEIVLLTKGRRGTDVWSTEEGAFRVPAYETSVRDPTGAGDALVGGFLITWLRKRDLRWSAAIGSAIASFVVERFGPSRFGTRKEIEERAETIMARTVRVKGG